jgi:hypothetical protein
MLIAVASFASGCANRLVFVTHSSLGLDISGTEALPNKVSLSFERYEAAIVPRKTNGEAHSVFGGMDSDLTWFHGHAINQTFATGEAAKLATEGEPGTLLETPKQDKAPLIFLTATTYGLNLSAGEQSMPPNLLVGYRREEATVIPIPDPAQEVRSVYADIHINSTGRVNPVTTNFSTLGGVRIRQSFATGAAAEGLAKTSTVREKLAQAAGIDPKVVLELQSKDAKREAVLAAVSSDGKTVNGELLQKLLTGEDGKLLRGTESWGSDYGGKPLGEFKQELVFEGDRLVDTLVARSKKLR